MKKLLATILIMIIVLATPFVIVVAFCDSFGVQYDETYLGAMSDKYNRLNQINQPKIILVGGSNLPFGIDSKILEDSTGMQVVNFGLYAALGSKTTMDLSKSNINKGDIVIFVPEFSNQTYSNYINPEIILQTVDSNKAMIKNIPFEDIFATINAYPKYLGDKRQNYINNTKPQGNGVYARDAFNKYGDINYERQYNIMKDKYDSLNVVDINKDIITNDFIDYFNKYAKFIRRKEAQIFISFPPVNALSVVDYTSQKTNDFYEYVYKNFDATIISNIEDYIMQAGYFYDSNYHLNDSGKVARTIKLLGDINRQLGNTNPIEIIMPAPSGFLPSEPLPDKGEQDDLLSLDFEYITKDSYIQITGLSNLGKTKEIVEIPSMINEREVYSIAEGAFKDCTNVKKIIIRDNIQAYGNALFENCQNLLQVEIYLEPNNLKIPSVGDSLLRGCNPNLRLYFPVSVAIQIKNDYFWSKYNSYIKSMK